MRKALLFIVGAGIGLSSTAQSGNFEPVSITNVTKTISPVATLGNEEVANGAPEQQNNGPLPKAAVAETIIGTTTYDLQTNTAVARRLFRQPDGSAESVWTFSVDMGGSWPDRGSGYNHFDGTTWGPQPTVRVESVRTGWPEVVSTSAGREIVLCHDFGNNVLLKNDRSTIGSGAWNEVQLTGLQPKDTWPRMAVGGSNGQTIHVIALTLPVANGGTAFNGLDGALLYSRSVDGGASWNIQSIQLPGADATNFTGFGADSYSIDTKGDTVVIAYTGLGQGVALWKSTDNGTNWTFTWAVAPQIPLFDETVHNTDIILGGDSMYTSDGTNSVILDDNGMAHIFWGLQYLINDDITDGLLTFFPGMNGIDYWNENMGTNGPYTIAGSFATNIIAFPSYRFNGMAGYPSTGIDSTGCLYVTYSALTDNSNTIQNYRHIYAIKSCDGGCTWSWPIDLTPLDNFAECVYASLAKDVDQDVHFIYQKDFEPGISVNGDTDPVGQNEIVYVTEASSRLDTLPTTCLGYITGDSIFCAGDSVQLTASCGTAWLWSSGETTQTIWASVFGGLSVNITTPCGVVIRNINLGASSQPPVATISGTTNVCAGDSTQLTAGSVAGASYLWSNGDTSISTYATMTGMYWVSVTNCVGSDSTSVAVVAEAGPALDSLTTSGSAQTFCDGSGPATLTVAGASGNVTGYQWYLNGTPIAPPLGTSSFYTVNTVAQSGNYTCTVYNSCGDSAVSGALTITVNPLPAAPTCTYDAATNTWTNSATGVSYQWYAGPQGSGTPIPGETGASITDASWQTHDGQNVYVVITDPNGCSNECQGIVTVDEISLANAMSIYPNPNNGEFTLSFAGAATDLYTVEVKNVLGQVISSDAYSVSGNLNLDLDLRDAEKGVYFITITNSDSKHTEKVVIK